MGHQLSQAQRILDALVREDYGGLASRVDGDLLRLPGRTLRLRPDGFLADQAVAEEVTLDEVIGVVRAVADPRDDVTAFERECREAATARRLYESVRPRASGLTRYEALAASIDHPVYPTSRCRLGLSERELLAYAPEFAPAFSLRWAAVDAVEERGERPGWLPEGLFPVHPLAARLLPTVPGPELVVRPTLSMRTVVVDPLTHLKLPMPTSTLGLRNRRVIMPGTLADGALVERLLRPLTGDDVLLADEQTYAHADDPMLGYLVRRLPAPGVPVAALPVCARELGEVAEVFDAYLRVLFDWNVRLFAHGIALEAHQQNVSVVPGPPLRLMIKDNDGAMLLREPWGRHEFADERLVTDDRSALARVFVTITLHLCAGALAFAFAERGLLPLRTGLALIRARLDEALRAYDDGFLRSRTLDAARLPGKAMLTAGTLVGKDRTGARDINKHYGPPGPNYLRSPGI